MKFEEMLEQLRKGEKVRRKGWGNKKFYLQKDKKWFGIDMPGIELNDIFAADWGIYHEPILDEVERRYLRNVIRPFRDRLVCIKKVGDSTNSFEYITIRIASSAYINSWSDIDFPFFKTNTMYKGMKANKEYTLEELGL